MHGACQPAASYHLLGLLAPWYAARSSWLARVGAPSPGVTHARQEPCLPHASQAVAPGACLRACLLACQLPACGLGPFVACGLWPGQQVWTLGLRMLGLAAAVSRRNTKDRIDRQTGWAEVAKLPAYKSQRLTRPPRPPARAQTRCSSLLGVIPAATNNLSCTRFKSALWNVGLVRLGGSVT